MAAVAAFACCLFTAAYAQAILPLFGLPGVGVRVGGFQCRKPDRANGAFEPRAGSDGGGAGKQHRVESGRQQADANAYRADRWPLAGACIDVYHTMGPGTAAAVRRAALAIETALAAGARQAQ